MKILFLYFITYKLSECYMIHCVSIDRTLLKSILVIIITYNALQYRRIRKKILIICWIHQSIYCIPIILCILPWSENNLHTRGVKFRLIAHIFFNIKHHYWSNYIFSSIPPFANNLFFLFCRFSSINRNV